MFRAENNYGLWQRVLAGKALEGMRSNRATEHVTGVRSNESGKTALHRRRRRGCTELMPKTAVYLSFEQTGFCLIKPARYRWFSNHKFLLLNLFV